ncbi:Cinnamyl-alcohol dehydrogenase Flavonol reductase/cinnamoyl-CoA reductase [Microbotryomycetes sp. NB124-2]
MPDGNLSWNTNNDTLRNAFEQFGQVVDCIVMTEPGTGRSRGFGFVTFADQSAADAAISAMNDQELVRPP